MADLSKILPITLVYEGGWADNPHDPGGDTMKGVTLATFDEFYPGSNATELRNISDTQLEHIYDVGYFQPISGSLLSQGVGLVAFDYGVNSGTSRAKKALASTSTLSGLARVKAISDARLSFLHALSTWTYFGAGWSRRVGGIEAQAIRWESATPAEAEIAVQKTVIQVQKTAAAHKNAVVVAGVTAAPTVTSQVVSQVDSTHTLPLSAAIVIGVVLFGIAVVCSVLAFHNSQRAAALKA